ncbi:MAG: SpoIIE family protein phosphatase [Bacteroidales bacterium]|nr:SpoIIE family protein phosphatase [Bacteroidales bacterium]
MMRNGMKMLFQKWLLAVVSGASIVTIAIFWWTQTTMAWDAGVNVLRIRLDDAKEEVIHNQKNLEKVIKIAADAALAQAKTFAHMVAADPSILKDTAKLEIIRQDLWVDELHVSDSKGVLMACIPTYAIGYDMASSPQSAAFMPALTDKDFELVQELQPNGSQNRSVQYAGVARKDRPGIVQVGYTAQTVEEEMKLADVNYIASTFRIGKNGRLQVIDNPDTESTEEKIFEAEVEGEKSLCMSVPCGKYLLIGSYPESEMYSARNSVLWVLIFATIVLFTVIFFQVSSLLQTVVINGISSVNKSLEAITAGDLNEKISVRTTSEFQALSDGINTTVEALEKSIETEAKRLDAELDMGRTIQASVLPVNFPDTDRYCIGAGMFTAKEVGGDFYDFFKIGEDKVAVLIADVSGKGLTAALYMMGSKAYLKERIISSTQGPATAIEQVNKELCNNNRAHMFLTLFAAVLDLKTGVLTCVNAGHNPPLVRHADGTWEYLKIKHSLPIGISSKCQYFNIDMKFERGDRLFLYTDGVTEAKNEDNKLYGEDRLLQELRSMTGTPMELIGNLKDKLDEYSTGVPQNDDITMLVLDYKND